MELKETPAVEDQSLLTSQPTVHIIKSTSKDGRQGKEGNREEKQDIFCLNLKWGENFPSSSLKLYFWTYTYFFFEY